MPARPYPRWQRRHKAVLYWMLQNPRRPLKDCARETVYTIKPPTTSSRRKSRAPRSPDTAPHAAAHCNEVTRNSAGPCCEMNRAE